MLLVSLAIYNIVFPPLIIGIQEQEQLLLGFEKSKFRVRKRDSKSIPLF